MPTTDELLAQVPLFKDLSKKHLQKVSNLATRIDLPAGKVLAREGRASVRARIWPLLAASDGADPTWADSAFAMQVVAENDCGGSLRSNAVVVTIP